MDHSAAQHFEPSRRAIGLLPGNVDLGARLGKGEVAGTKAHLEIALEERSHECSQRAFQARKTRVLVDQQAFNLMKHRSVRLVAIAAIHLPGRNHPQGWRAAVSQQILHVAHLHAGGVRAQQPSIAEVERVMHRPRRMVRREVERFEVVPVVLDFRTVRQGIPQARKDVGDPLQGRADRMQRAAPGIDAGQGHVNRLACNTRVEHGVVQRDASRAERVRQRVTRTVDLLTRGLARIGWQRSQPFQELRHAA